MKKILYLFVCINFISMPLSAQVLSQSIDIHEAMERMTDFDFDEWNKTDLVFKNGSDEMMIRHDGQVIYKDFTYKLLDVESRGIYQLGQYIGLVYKDFIVASMWIDSDGVIVALVFADTRNNEIILEEGTFPSMDFESAIGIENMIILLYSTMAVSYDLDTKQIIWKSTWDKSGKGPYIEGAKPLVHKNFLIVPVFQSIENISINYKTGEWSISKPEKEDTSNNIVPKNETVREPVGWWQKFLDWWSGK